MIKLARGQQQLKKKKTLGEKSKGGEAFYWQSKYLK